MHPEREEDWDRLILKNNFTEFLQSFFWSRILQRMYGYKPFFLQITDTGNPSAFFSFQVQFPYIKENSLKYRVINGASNLFFQKLVASGGPVIVRDENTEQIVSSLLAYLDSYSQKHHAFSIDLSPFRYEPHYSKDPGILSVFEQFGYTRKIWGTYLVDLTQNEDKLWMSFEHSARKSLKQMEGRGVIIKKVSGHQEFIENFVIPYNRLEKEFGRSEIPLWFAENIKNTGNQDKYYHYFYAELDDNTVAVLGMYVYNRYATEIMSATSKYTYENKLYAQDLLHWEMFKYAKDLGCHTFDLAGVNPNPANAKEEGIHRFKKKWGGEYIEYPIFEKECTGIKNQIVREIIIIGRKLMVKKQI